MKSWTMAMAVALCGVMVLAGDVLGEEKAPVDAGAMARMPVKEVTVFKDGHAFVLHEGSMPTNEAGEVVMDYLPTPVLGTFWPYSAEKGARLTSVVAGQRKVTTRLTALSVRELLEANVGAEAVITDNSNVRYLVEIVGMLNRSAEELEAALPPGSGPRLPQKGNLILVKVKTDGGVKAMDVNRITDVTFITPPKTVVGNEEFRNLLTLRLDWQGGKPEKTAKVGLVYVQKGIRWIPNYRIEIDGKGKAVVKLQATLLNEMTDLSDVTAHLVIGVPTFAFKDTTDPMALQQTVAGLSEHFREDARTAFALSNAIMSQSARMTEVRPAAAPPAGMDLGPEIGGAAKNEDLFVFTVEHITLRKGERMVIPVAEYTLDYTDVYTLSLPFAPPPEVRRSFNNSQQAELARLFSAPKVMHKARLINKAKYPLTTAPVLIFREGRILGQGMMTYTAIGGTTDLEIGTAVDVQVKKTEKETKRTPDAMVWQGTRFGRVDLEGTVTLTSHLDKPIALEVQRLLLGNIDTVDDKGAKEQTSASNDDNYFAFADYPYWWHWHNWPGWWSHFNGVGRANWKFTLEPGKSVDMSYTWHYFWAW